MASLRVEIFPDDLDATADFYVRVLGFSLVRDERGESPGYIALELGSARVGAAYRPATAAGPRRPPVGVELVLEVDDLEEVRARILDEEWPLDADLVEQPWGLRDLRVLDPSGYYWRVTERAADRR